MTSEETNEKTLPPPWDRIFSLATRTFVWALLIAVLYILRPFLLLVFLTFVFAYIQAHGVEGLAHRIKNRALRVVIVGLVFLGTLFATGFTLLPQVQEQAKTVPEQQGRLHRGRGQAAQLVLVRVSVDLLSRWPSRRRPSQDTGEVPSAQGDQSRARPGETSPTESEDSEARTAIEGDRPNERRERFERPSRQERSRTPRSDQRRRRSRNQGAAEPAPGPRPRRQRRQVASGESARDRPVGADLCILVPAVAAVLVLDRARSAQDHARREGPGQHQDRVHLRRSRGQHRRLWPRAGARSRGAAVHRRLQYHPDGGLHLANGHSQPAGAVDDRVLLQLHPGGRHVHQLDARLRCWRCRAAAYPRCCS